MLHVIAVAEMRRAVDRRHACDAVILDSSTFFVLRPDSFDGGDWGDWRNQPVSGPNQYGVSNMSAVRWCVRVAIVYSIRSDLTRRNTSEVKSQTPRHESQL